RRELAAPQPRDHARIESDPRPFDVFLGFGQLEGSLSRDQIESCARTSASSLITLRLKRGCTATRPPLAPSGRTPSSACRNRVASSIAGGGGGLAINVGGGGRLEGGTAAGGALSSLFRSLKGESKTRRAAGTGSVFSSDFVLRFVPIDPHLNPRCFR